MQRDVNDLAVSLAAPDAVAEWDAVQRGFLAHAAATPLHLGRLLAAAPDFALGHAAQGLFCLLLGRSELLPAARAALRRAEAGAALPRERLYLNALRAGLSGRLGLAARTLEQVLEVWPRDALAMKLVQALSFMLGDPRAMLASADAVAPVWGDHPFRGYLLGCRAFALEETGACREAEAEGRAALDLAPDDAWALHAVAHVFDRTGRAADGVRWLAGRSRHWAHCNNFGFHVWWHLALFHLDRGAFGPALELYDRKVRPQPTDDFRDIANAASLLLRLECEGVSVGRRWEALADLAAARTGDGALVFAALHYQVALVRAGRAEAAERLAARLAADAGQVGHDQHEVAALSGLAIARGLLRFREGRHAEALAEFRAGLVELPCLGGSLAQRDLFWRLAVEAALRAGETRAALDLLAQRRSARGAEDGYLRRRLAEIGARGTEAAAALGAEARP